MPKAVQQVHSAGLRERLEATPDEDEVYHELQLSENLRSAIDAANNKSSNDGADGQSLRLTTTNGTSDHGTDERGSISERIKELEEENASLKREVARLRQQSGTLFGHPGEISI